MYQITVEGHFDAAHALRGYQGKCENIHGHRYRVAVSVKAAGLNEIGLAYDFTELKKHLGDILGRYDHTSLNDIPPFDKINPSAENLAATIHKELKIRLKDAPVTLVSVTVWESPGSSVEYREE
jgi:6-pyruvoyltetrahydropterin/6-carboxytetrahydropterin synthase